MMLKRSCGQSQSVECLRKSDPGCGLEGEEAKGADGCRWEGALHGCCV